MKISKHFHTYMIVVVLLAAFLRILGLDKGIWLDEYFSIQIITGENFLAALRTTDHPPLYFILLWLWSLFGTSEPVLRLFSVGFGIATVIIMIRWMKFYSYTAGLIAGLLTSSLPVMLWYSQEIRNYSILLFAAALSFYFAAHLASKPGEFSGYIGLAFALTLAVAGHLVGVFLIPVVVLFIVASVNYRNVHAGRFVMAVAIPTMVFLLLYFFFLPHELRDRTAENWWIPPVSLGGVAYVAKTYLGIPSILQFSQMLPTFLRLPMIVFLIILFVVFVANLLYGSWRQSYPFLFATVSYWVFIITYSIIVVPIFWDRTGLLGIIPLIGFISLQVDTIRSQYLRSGSIWALIIGCLIFSLAWTAHGSQQPLEAWRQVARTMELNQSEGEKIIFYPSYAKGPTLYYYPDFPREATFSFWDESDFERLDSFIEVPDTSMEAASSSTMFLVIHADVNVLRDWETYQRLLEVLASKYGNPQILLDKGSLILILYSN